MTKIYYTKSSLATAFSISRPTVAVICDEIKNEMKNGRYNQYAICDKKIHVGVFADYYKYRKRLKDKNARKIVPPFNLYSALSMIPGANEELPQESNSMNILDANSAFKLEFVLSGNEIQHAQLLKVDQLEGDFMANKNKSVITIEDMEAMNREFRIEFIIADGKIKGALIRKSKN